MFLYSAVEPGVEKSIGRFGWGTRNREGRELVEMLRRNGLAVAGTFFQKKESHKITYRSGRHKTELDLLVVRQQQIRRVKDCRALAGEYATTQHKPVFFEVRMKKWKEKRTMGPKNFKWWTCKDEIMVEYRERVSRKRKYEELDAEKGTVEGEWRLYKDASVGVADELCGRTSGKWGTPRSRNQGWWTDEVAKAVGEKREALKIIECIKDIVEQPPICLKHLYGQKKKAAMRAVDRARRNTEEELHQKLDEDGGKKIIFKMARDRTEDGRDVKRGAMIKDNNGRLITESKEVLRIWAANVKELLSGKGAASCLKLPSSVRREVEVEVIGHEEVETAMHKMKKGKAAGVDELRLEMLDMAGEVGVKWTGRLLNVCMQEGRMPKEWRMGRIVPIWKRKGMFMTQESTGASHYSVKYWNCWRGF